MPPRAAATAPLLKRLLPSLRKRMAWLLWPEGQGVTRRDGVLFLVNLRNWADKTLLSRGIFEREQLDYLLRNIRDRNCTVFLDIGANMGAYSLFVALKSDCRRIVSFEPDPRSFDRLRANALLNGLSRVIEARQIVVSRSNEPVMFRDGPDSFDAVSRVADGEGTRMVPATRLDDAIPLRGQRIAVKMDIEEHELAALEGMTALLRGNECFLQVECFAAHLSAFAEAIGRHGYRLVHEIGNDRYFANF